MPDLGLNTFMYTSHMSIIPSYTLEDTIDRIEEIGYDSIELCATTPHAWPQHTDEDRLTEIRDLLDESDLRVSSVVPGIGGGPGLNPASPIKAERDASYEHYKWCLELTDALGGDLVVWVGGWHLEGQSRSDAWENMRETLDRTVAVAEDLDVDLVIEATPADTNLVETPEDQLTLLDEVDSDSVGLMLDTFHSDYLDYPLTDYVDDVFDDLLHVHLADTDRLAPGEGELSFVPMFERLEELGYDAAYTTEMFGVDPEVAAEKAHSNLAEMFSQIE